MVTRPNAGVSLRFKVTKMKKQEPGSEQAVEQVSEDQKNDGATNAYGAELLIAALESQSFKRGHVVSDLAVALGVHPAHWYRLRAHPRLLARCGRHTHQGMADYLEWPLGRVLLACGVITHEDFELVLGGPDVVSSSIEEIEAGPYGAALINPLRSATRDHQLLMAELYFGLRTETVRARRTCEKLANPPGSSRTATSQANQKLQSR